jgi:hypothetical protein
LTVEGESLKVAKEITREGMNIVRRVVGVSTR